MARVRSAVAVPPLSARYRARAKSYSGARVGPAGGDDLAVGLDHDAVCLVEVVAEVGDDLAAGSEGGVEAAVGVVPRAKSSRAPSAGMATA